LGRRLWRLWPILPSLHLLPLFFSLSDSPGNTTLYLMAALIDSGLGGLLHLIHGLGGGTADMGLLRDGATAPLLLGQLLFQLGRHDPLDLLLRWLAVLAFSLIFYFVSLVSFSYFGHFTS
jgi:hypothetical protein